MTTKPTIKSLLRHDEIKRLRKKAGLSLEVAGSIAFNDCPSPAPRWHAIESGRNTDIRISTLFSMAAALGVNPMAILVTPKDAANILVDIRVDK